MELAKMATVIAKTHRRIFSLSEHSLMSSIPSPMNRSAKGADLSWSDLHLLLAVCRAGSLAGAARILGKNHSTVFRRLNAIEEQTGVRFFERLSDGCKMTDAGRSALTYAERVEAEMHALSREVLGQDSRLQGKIRVTAPENFMAEWGPRLFAKFRRQHPEIVIEAIGDLGAADLSRREADIAIRATANPPPTAVGRAICDFRFAFYASREYRAQHPDVPLAEHDWVMVSGLTSWLVPHIWKKVAQGEERIVFSSPNIAAVMSAVAEGMGITLMSCYTGDTDKRIVRIAPPLEAKTIKLWLLTHEDLRHTARVKTLLAFLREELSAHADLFAGKMPS